MIGPRGLSDRRRVPCRPISDNPRHRTRSQPVVLVARRHACAAPAVALGEQSPGCTAPVAANAIHMQAHGRVRQEERPTWPNVLSKTVPRTVGRGGLGVFSEVTQKGVVTGRPWSRFPPDLSSPYTQQCHHARSRRASSATPWREETASPGTVWAAGADYGNSPREHPWDLAACPDSRARETLSQPTSRQISAQTCPERRDGTRRRLAGAFIR